MRLGDRQPAAHLGNGAQELAGISRAQVRIPAGGQRHQCVQGRGQPGRDAGRRRDDLVDMLVSDLERRLAFVRLHAREQFEQHHTGCVDIGPRVRDAA